MRAKHYLLHGENHVDSRKFLNDLLLQARTKGLEVIKLDSKNTNHQELLTVTRENTLFSVGNLIVLENFFSTSKNTSPLLTKTIEKMDGTNNILILWEKKTVPAGTLKKLSGYFQTKEFKIPNLVFQFLDSLSPNNTKASLHLFKPINKTHPPEFVLVMLARQLKLLIWAKLEPQTLKVPTWQKSKLIAQAEKFTAKQLLRLHAKLLEIDRLHKHSQLPENLSASLELLVISL